MATTTPARPTSLPSQSASFQAFLDQMRTEMPQAETDPALQCRHGVSLYRDCRPCGT